MAYAVEVQAAYTKRQREGCANKETKRLTNQAQRKRKLVRDLLAQMYVWQSLGTDEPPSSFALTEAQVKQLWTPGEQPWFDTAGSSARAQQRYHGRHYLSARADLERSMEEQPILRVERARLERGLRFAQAQMQAALQRHQQPGGCLGAAFLVQRRIAEVEAQLRVVTAWGPW